MNHWTNHWHQQPRLPYALPADAIAAGYTDVCWHSSLYPGNCPWQHQPNTYCISCNNPTNNWDLWDIRKLERPREFGIHIAPGPRFCTTQT